MAIFSITAWWVQTVRANQCSRCFALGDGEESIKTLRQKRKILFWRSNPKTPGVRSVDDFDNNDNRVDIDLPEIVITRRICSQW